MPLGRAKNSGTITATVSVDEGIAMEPATGVRKTPLIVFAVLVCLITVVVGVFFGFLAGGGYVLSLRDEVSSRYPGQMLLATGSLVGTTGGLIAALAWCRAMYRRILSGTSGGKYVGTGGKRGVIVGVAATVVLHTVLIIAAIHFAVPLTVMRALSLIAIGLGCALVAGGGFGLLFGAICGWIARRATSHGFPVDVLPPAAE